MKSKRKIYLIYKQGISQVDLNYHGIIEVYSSLEKAKLRVKKLNLTHKNRFHHMVVEMDVNQKEK